MKRSPQNSSTQRRALRRAAVLGVATSGVLTLALSVMSGAAHSPTTIKVAQNTTWGPTLTLKDGVTLYRLSKDSKDKSRCSGTCATIWVPVLLATGQAKPVGLGVTHLGSFTRADGSRQVTYEGIPLYRFTGDRAAGEVTGNVSDTWGKWSSINPKSPLTPPKKLGTTTTTTGGYGSGY